MNDPLGRASRGQEWASDEENRSCRLWEKSEIPDPVDDISHPSRPTPESSRSTEYFLTSNCSDPNASERDNNNDDGSDNEDMQINGPRRIAGLRGASKTESSTEVRSENETNAGQSGFGTSPGTSFSSMETDGNVEMLSNCEKDLDLHVVKRNTRRGSGKITDISCASGQASQGREGNLSNTPRNNPYPDFSDGGGVSKTSVSGGNIKRNSRVKKLPKKQDLIEGSMNKRLVVKKSSISPSDVNDVVMAEITGGRTDVNDDNAGPSLSVACEEEHSPTAFVCPDLDNYLEEGTQPQTNEENRSLNAKRGNRSHDENLPSTSTASELRKQCSSSGPDFPLPIKPTRSTRNTRNSKQKFQGPLRRSLRNRNIGAKNENNPSCSQNKNSDVKKRKKGVRGKKRIDDVTTPGSASAVEQKLLGSSVLVKKVAVNGQNLVLPLSCCFRHKSEGILPINNILNDEVRRTETGARRLEGRGKTNSSATGSRRKSDDADSELGSNHKTRVQITHRRNSKPTFVGGSPVNDKVLWESRATPPEVVVVEDDEEVVVNANDYASLNCDPNFIIEEISMICFERTAPDGVLFEETAQVFRLIGKLLPEVALLQEINHAGKNEPNLRWWIVNIMQDFTCIKFKINQKVGAIWRRAVMKTRKTNSPCFISFKGSNTSRPMGIVVNPSLWPYFLIGPYYLHDCHEMSLNVDGKPSKIDYFPPFESVEPNCRLKRFVSSVIIHSWRNKRDIIGMWLHERIGMKSYNFIEVLTKTRNIEFFDPLVETEVMLPSVPQVTAEKYLNKNSSDKNVTRKERVKKPKKIYLVPDIPDLGYVEATLNPDETITVERPLYFVEKLPRKRISGFVNKAINEQLTDVTDEVNVKWTIVKRFSEIKENKCLQILDITKIGIILEIESLERQSQHLMNDKIKLEKERQSLFRKYLNCLESCDLEENAKRTIQVYLNRIISRAQMEQGILPGRSESETHLCLHILNMFLLVTLAKWSGSSETSPQLRTDGESSVPNHASADERKEDGQRDGIRSKRHLSPETLDKLDCKLRILFEILGKSKSPDVATHTRLKSKLNSLARYIEEMRIDAIYSAANEIDPQPSPGISRNASRKGKSGNRKQKEE